MSIKFELSCTVATTVEVRENVTTRYKVWISELVSQQQAHMRSNRNTYITSALNKKTTFVKILLIKIADYSTCQNFAPLNIYTIWYIFVCFL